MLVTKGMDFFFQETRNRVHLQNQPRNSNQSRTFLNICSNPQYNYNNLFEGLKNE